MTLLPRRLFAITLVAALIVIGERSACAQWMQTSGPNGGAVSALVQSGTDLFAATQIGVFRSADSGASWFVASTGLQTDEYGQYYPVGALVRSGSALLTGTSFPGGAFRSTDKGESWQPAGLADTSVGSFAVLGSNLFVSTDFGVLRSTDNGSNWVPASNGLDDPLGTVWVAGSTLLFAPYEGDIYTSQDTGQTWTQAYAANEIAVTGFASIGTNVFGSTREGILLSTNGGLSWALAADSGSLRGISCLIASDTTLIAGTLSGVVLSNNYSATWSPTAGHGLFNTDILSLIVSGAGLYAGTNGGGVYRSADVGTNWVWKSLGLPYLYSRNVAASGEHLFSMTEQGVFRSDDKGASWIPANVGVSQSNFQQFAVMDTNIYAAGGGIYITSDNTQGWRMASDNGLLDSAFLLITSGTNLVAATVDSGIFLSTDFGGSWRSGGLRDSSIVSLASLGTDLFAVTSFAYPDSITNSPIYKYRIHRSTDSGAHWTNISGGLPDSLNEVLATNGSNLFMAASGAGVFLSTDRGTSWTAVDNGLPSDVYISSLASSGENLFAGFQGGVYLSVDNGSNWSDVSSGIENANVTGLAASDSDLFAATDSGVWRRPLSEMIPQSSVAEAPAASMPSVLTYPNPSSQSTTISVNSETAGYVNVIIVNALGTEVARLFSGELAPGEHQFSWSDPAVTNGVYECLVRMNGRVQRAGIIVSR